MKDPILQHWFPDLYRVESARERRKLWRAACKQASNNWRWFVGAGLGPLVVGTISFIPLLYGRMILYALLSGIVGAVGGMFGTYLACWLLRDELAKKLRGELNRAGYQLCVLCGYDLRGQVDSRCPECGATAEERIVGKYEGSWSQG